MDRKYFLEQIDFSFQVTPIVAILGPRQCGKTTLARLYAEQLSDQMSEINHFDLERTSDVLRLSDPEFTLGQLKHLVIIDEIQRMPELFNHLRVLVDRPDCSTKFLILGSASRHLIQHSADSLAGRISYIELTPFSLFETQENSETLFKRGGFPRAFLSESDPIAFAWLHNYIRTYLEQDIPNLGIKILPDNLRRFWMMLAHVHGQIFNASELGRSLSLSYHTIQHYLDILSQTFMVRRLLPWHENISKRQVKSPKIYFRDSGILFTLLGAETHEAQMLHPKLGAAWEGFALEQVIQTLHASTENTFFWATHSTAEIDLIVLHKGQKLGFEFKFGSAVKVTPSMNIALKTLGLDHIVVIHAGDRRYPLADRIEAVPLLEFCKNSQSSV